MLELKAILGSLGASPLRRPCAKMAPLFFTQGITYLPLMRP